MIHLRKGRSLLAAITLFLPLAADAGSEANRNLRQAEYQLSQLGYDPGPIDGLVTPETNSALRIFQLQAGLRSSGWLDDGTWAALLEVAMLRIQADDSVNLPLPDITSWAPFHNEGANQPR